MNIFYYFASIYFPPLAVFLKTTNKKPFYLNCLFYGLTIGLFVRAPDFAALPYIPAMLHACYIVYKNKDTSRAIQKRKKFEQEEKEKNKLAELEKKAKMIEEEKIKKAKLIEEEKIKKEEEKKVKEMQEARRKKEEEKRKKEEEIRKKEEEIRKIEDKINGYWDVIINQKKLQIPKLSQSSLDYFGTLYGKSITKLFTLPSSEVAQVIKGLTENGVIVLKIRVYDMLLEKGIKEEKLDELAVYKPETL